MPSKHQAPEEAVAVSDRLPSILPAALRTGEVQAFLPEQQALVAGNHNDRGGDTDVADEVWQLSLLAEKRSHKCMSWPFHISTHCR